jgi:S-layer protein (TIGR01564 family)
MALGRYCAMPGDTFIKLDTEIRAEKKLKDNLILIGGPGVNLITAEFNEYLPVYLTGEAHGKAPKAVFGFDLYSERTKRRYKDPAIGYIIKCANPISKEHQLLVVAGLGRRGTLAAILALTRRATTIIHKSEPDEFSHVVRGIDIEGKGSIDDIEVLE